MGVLLSMPGIQRRTAEVVIAEIGTDMRRFPSSRHLASWAALGPGNKESAGNANTDAPPRAAHGCAPRWWKPPWAARKNGYLRAKYRRVRSRPWPSARGHRRGARAVGDHPHAAVPRRALHRSRRRLLRAPAGRAD